MKTIAGYDRRPPSEVGVPMCDDLSDISIHEPSIRPRESVSGLDGLLPCPFCGHETTDLNDDDEDCPGQYAIVCNINKGGCGASSGFTFSVATSKGLWDRREFMKGKVLVEAEDLNNLLEYAVRNPYLDESSPYRKSYNKLARALHPTSSGDANNE